MTIFADLDQRRAIFATPGRDAATVKAFTADLRAHGGHPDQILEVCQDMSEAYLIGVLRSSRRPRSQASLVETQQAFLEMHVEAFEWFGGVFAEIRFDNLTSAVKKVLRGRRRIETDRFVALRSHYLFESQFATPGIRGAHEKGGIEGEVGRHRRNHLVPVPTVATLAELNTDLLAGCERDLGRRIDGRPVTIGEAWAVERPLLRVLPG